MLCPEVCHFAAPKSNFTLVPNIKSNNNINFVYNHLVSVILPGSSDSIQHVLTTDSDYYKVSQLKVEELATKAFVKNFIQSGSLSLLSINTRIDCDNCIAVTPEGELHLNLDKVTYQSLGLEGRVSHFHSKNKERYCVSVDLKKATLKTVTCLKRLQPITAIVTWQPSEPDVCPSSIAKYVHDLDYKVQVCKCETTARTLNRVEIPKLRDSDPYEFVEWLGMVCLGCDLEADTSDGFITTYEPPPIGSEGPVTHIQWRGFFTTNQIARLRQELRPLVETHEWVALYVQGFSDSPIAWTNQEHHYYTNGDNAYILLMDKAGTMVCKQECTRKRYTNKVKTH